MPSMSESAKLGNPAHVRLVRPKYQIFVSSTFVDLRDERQSVTWEILRAGHIPVGMENFSAYDDRGWKVINRTLETTDYYVLILAGRYGSIDESIGMSWTEREYRRAIELEIPILAFIREKKFITGDQVDTDKKAKRLDALIADVSSKRLRETWTTPDDLRAKVSLALLKAIAEDETEGNSRPGWYRGNQLPSPTTMDELAHLSQENRTLREESERLRNQLVSSPQVTLQSSAYQQMIQGQTDSRVSFFLQHPDLLKWHLETRGFESKGETENKIKLYVLVKLDLHESMYLKHLGGTLTDEPWSAWHNVLRTDFRIDAFQEVWPKVRQFYAPNFAEFIDNDILLRTVSTLNSNVPDTPQDAAQQGRSLSPSEKEETPSPP